MDKANNINGKEYSKRDRIRAGVGTANAGNKKMAFKLGWNALPLKVKVTYLILCVFALVYHLVCAAILPPVIEVPMLFQAYSVTMASWVYLVISYFVLLLFIYLDCTNTALSKVKAFLPLVIFAADMYFISDFFMKH